MHSSTLQRLTARAGLIGSAAIALGSTLTALAYVGAQGQRYSPLNHYVSELGEVGVSAWAAVFNLSLISGGLCLAVFMIGLALPMKHWLKWPFGLIGLIAGVSGTLVGVFPMNNLEPHAIVALTFFNTGWIAVGLYTLYIVIARPDGLPRALIIPGALTVLSFIIFLSVIRLPSSAADGALASPTNRPDIWPVTIFEWLVIGSMLMWVFLMSLHLRAHPQPD